MVKKSRAKINNFYVLILAFFLTECANQLPPGGGDVDRIPPRVIEVYPQDETTNFNDDYFELGFSEYVDKRSVKEAIFISPAIDGELELDWSGKYVRIIFPANLKQNLTYVITIGTDVEDYNNRNKMADAFSFTFSTGPEIDRRMITGKVYDDKQQGVMLFAYLLKSNIPNPLEKKPDYISQASTNGNYKLAGLAAGAYRVFAVRDEFRDLLFQPDQDQIGIPYRDVKLEEADTLYSGLNFLLTKIDTVKPRLLSASMTDKDHILLNFSEELDWQTIKPFNFYLFDSTSNKRTDLMYSFKGNTKATELVLVPNGTFPIENAVFLFADSVWDKSGNVFHLDFTQVTLSEKVDTTKTELIKSSPASGSKEVDFLEPKFIFDFNDGFDVTNAREGISFSDTTNQKIHFEIEFVDNSSFVLKPLKRLEMSMDYVIKIDLSKLKDKAGNYFDSLYQYRFKTITGLDFTGASGKLMNTNDWKNLKLQLNSLEKNTLKYSSVPINNERFSFERIIPGKYLLFAYDDKDSSDTYTFGSVDPFNKSENFSFHADTLNLRARWIQSDVLFNLNSK